MQDGQRYLGGVAEPYWLNSRGGAVWVPGEQPLFYSWNDKVLNTKKLKASVLNFNFHTFSLQYLGAYRVLWILSTTTYKLFFDFYENFNMDSLYLKK